MANGPSLRRSLVLTTLVQGVVVLSTFVQYGLISRSRGVEALGDFSLLIRVRGLLEFAVLLILPMAIARELAMHLGASDPRNRRVVVQAGLMFGFTCLALSIGVMLLFQEATATILFGRASFAHWVVPFCLLLGGYAACLLVAAVARGLMNFESVNLLQFLYVAAWPIGLILLGDSLTLAQIVSGMGIGAAILACVFYFRVRPRGSSLEPGTAVLTRWQAGTGLVKYGAPRLLVIAGMSVQSLALPWLVNRHGDVVTLAALNSLLGVVSASTLLVAPLGLIMLPHLSRLIAGGLGSLAVIAAIRPVVTLWLGPEIAAHTALLIAAAFVVPAFLVLEVMRAPLDSVSTVPWNAVTYFCGAGMIVALFHIARGSFGWSIELAAAFSLCLGMLAAAAVSTSIGIRLYRLRFGDRSLRISAAIWLFGFLLLSTGYSWMSAWQHGIAGLVCVSIYLAAVVRFAPPWLVAMVPEPIRRRIW